MKSESSQRDNVIYQYLLEHKQINVTPLLVSARGLEFFGSQLNK